MAASLLPEFYECCTWHKGQQQHLSHNAFYLFFSWFHLSLHPTLPILATGSGQRKFPLPHLCLGSASGDSSENESGSEDDHEICDNSLKLWVFQRSGAYSPLDVDSTQCTGFELCDS